VFPIAPGRDFAWYLGDETGVVVTSVRDICQWLAACEYVRDRELFVMRDFWQHPRTFEQIRKGDCEDHALWAWRKLLELNLDARFFIGEWCDEGGRRHGGHAWVGFSADGEDWILEPTRRDAARMILPMAHARSRYLPYLSVDGDLRKQAYVGYLLYLRRGRRKTGGVERIV